MIKKIIRRLKYKCKKWLKRLYILAVLASICVYCMFIDLHDSPESYCLIWFSINEADLIYTDETRSELIRIINEHGNDSEFIYFSEYNKFKGNDSTVITNEYIRDCSEAMDILFLLQPDKSVLDTCNSFIRNYIKVNAYYDVMAVTDHDCEDYYYIMYTLQRDVLPYYPYLLNRYYRFVYMNWQYIFVGATVVLGGTLIWIAAFVIKVVAEVIRENKRGGV